MSETSQPGDRADDSGQQSEASPEQPSQPQTAGQPGEKPAEQPIGATQQASTRSARTRRTWVAAAAVGAALLLGGGVGGYFIGAAAADDRPDPRIGIWGEFPRGDHWPGDMPGERGEFPGSPPWHDRGGR